VTADLLEIDTQTLRRLETAAGLTSERPSGNQRRFSRSDIGRLARAAELNRQGTPAAAIGRILDLEQQVADLSPGDGDRA
jgi:DNA-binding transcriptional MerR regulator